MRPIFLFVLTLSFGFQAKAQLVDDFEVINVLLAEFEKKELLPRDIYPLISPPPESREKFIKLRDDLTPEDADSLFSRIERSYETRTSSSGTYPNFFFTFAFHFGYLIRGSIGSAQSNSITHSAIT